MNKQDTPYLDRKQFLAFYLQLLQKHTGEDIAAIQQPPPVH